MTPRQSLSAMEEHGERGDGPREGSCTLLRRDGWERREKERECSLFSLVACTHIGKDPSYPFFALCQFFCQLENTVANCGRLMITRSIVLLNVRARWWLTLSSFFFRQNFHLWMLPTEWQAWWFHSSMADCYYVIGVREWLIRKRLWDWKLK